MNIEEQKPMATPQQQLEQDLEKLGNTALKVKSERDALLIAAQKAYAALDDRYDAEQFTDGSVKEYPFGGAGEVMRVLKAAIDKAVA